MAIHLFVPVSLVVHIWVISFTYIFESIRFRRAWKVQGHSVEELPFRAFGGVYGSWFGVILVILVLIAQFYIVRTILSSCCSLVDCFLANRLSGLLVACLPIPGSSQKISSVRKLPSCPSTFR